MQKIKLPYGYRLLNQHHLFTNGSMHWSDTYKLETWDRSIQPVVYLNEVYNGYELLRRLGPWCWLTKDPKTREFLTVKFISRPGDNEVKINKFVAANTISPYISRIKDAFTIPHHLAREQLYSDIKFNTIVYPTTGADLDRIYTCCEHPESPSPLSISQRIQCIRHLVRAITELHRIGVVHADIHPGNVALPPPSDSNIERLLQREPVVDSIRRKDGKPTAPTLPERVTEPIDTGYGRGHVQVIDFGYAFRPIKGATYPKDAFPGGIPPPPELLRKGSETDRPFLADSWYLGYTIYFILTNGGRIFDRPFTERDEVMRAHYRKYISALNIDEDAGMQSIPVDIRDKFKPVLLSLLCQDPAHRLSVEELSRNEWLMGGETLMFE